VTTPATIEQPAKPAETYAVCSWVFLRLLGATYLMAFLSFGVQAQGLIGSRGILPVAEFLSTVHGYYGATAYRILPTLLWLGSSDAAIRAVWIIGCVLSLVLMLGSNWRAVRIALFIFYLSLTNGGQQFMGYQWDALLLEAGFLAIFLGSAPVVVRLFRWLLFRLMFLSGAVKLLSHDKTWQNFTALPIHYQTQPLPTPLAWYFFQLPGWFQRVSVGVVFVIELGVPLLIFAPRRIRMGAAAAIVFLQVMIALTGNYAFFNFLAIALCLFLLDDEFIGRIFPARWMTRIAQRFRLETARWHRVVAGVLAVFIFWVSSFQIAATFSGFHWRPVDEVLQAIAPFDIVNTYGLFAVMTTARPEIVIEGSNDGESWQAYEFKYKPGDPQRRPTFVAPHQPRLDWQMWFAALGNYQSDPWTLHFIGRLLEGSPDVLALLEHNPFPEAPPRYVRAELYEYRFATPQEHYDTKVWWVRERKADYVPPVSMKQ
jgi:hypothetical protein